VALQSFVSKAGAKLLLFFEIRKFLSVFLQDKYKMSNFAA